MNKRNLLLLIILMAIFFVRDVNAQSEFGVKAGLNLADIAALNCDGSIDALQLRLL